MTYGQSFYVEYKWASTSLEALRSKLVLLKRHRDRLIAHSGPAESISAQEITGMPGGYVYIPEISVINDISLTVIAIALTEEDIKDAEEHITGLKKLASATASVIGDKDTTLKVFKARFIDGLSPYETARVLGYEMQTVWNETTAINQLMNGSTTQQ